MRRKPRRAARPARRPDASWAVDLERRVVELEPQLRLAEREHVAPDRWRQRGRDLDAVAGRDAAHLLLPPGAPVLVHDALPGEPFSARSRRCAGRAHAQPLRSRVEDARQLGFPRLRRQRPGELEPLLAGIDRTPEGDLPAIQCEAAREGTRVSFEAGGALRERGPEQRLATLTLGLGYEDHPRSRIAQRVRFVHEQALAAALELPARLLDAHTRGVRGGVGDRHEGRVLDLAAAESNPHAEGHLAHAHADQIDGSRDRSRRSRRRSGLPRRSRLPARREARIRAARRAARGARPPRAGRLACTIRPRIVPAPPGTSGVAAGGVCALRRSRPRVRSPHRPSARRGSSAARSGAAIAVRPHHGERAEHEDGGRRSRSS